MPSNYSKFEFMKKYDHIKIEKKWQKYWETKKTFQAKDVDKRPKQYILDMFPYPSGAGLHVGHPEGYTATDILSRYSRMRGINVLHPMGWDAFGLPAENYAIKEGVHPQKTTQKNIKRFTEQIKSLGLSYDWSRQVNTSDPSYYKWTQWLFLQLYKKGLAYKKEASVNWCPKDNTVLANEQVIDGKCERCGSTVVQKNLSQWFFKITDYAEELLSELNNLDWPDPIKLMQRNWIGKSMGAEIDFTLAQPPVKRYVILHGRGGGPEKNFIPWLKKELESKGFEVQVPAMPNPNEPGDVEQAEFVKNNCTLDEQTVVIGHSFGGVVALRLLEQGIKLNRVVLVSTPFSANFLDGKKRPSVEAALNKGFNFDVIKKNTCFTLLYDSSDYVVPITDGEAFEKNLDFSLFKFKAQNPHFTATEEPEVLNVALGNVKVFTTRPDTIFGATYLVLAPEHPTAKAIARHVENSKEVFAYIEAAKSKTELQRSALEKEKSGVELKGAFAINPATKEKVPIWVADYVLMGYGTGAIMAVPAHDERDAAFAEKYKLPIKQVVNEQEKLIESNEFTGQDIAQAKIGIAKKFGKLTTKYKLRDWLVSRQRYWGAPIPIIYCKDCGEQPVLEKDLPVKLPTDVDFRPTGESPLKRSKSFKKVTCPVCKKPAERDYDTMDTFVDSSWYFLRYTDPNNKKEFASAKKIKQWLPVNTYIGGAEHAVLHLLYSRFFVKALRDLKMLDFGEPFLKLRNIGLILGPDGEKMSKSRGNVINPDDVVKQFGADSLRMFEMFMGPLEDAKPWMTQGIVGIKRFLDRIWFWVNDLEANKKFATNSPKAQKHLHKLTKKITEDITQYHFNTCISAFMEFHNQTKDEPVSKEFVSTFLKLLYPFAPHMSEELHLIIGGKKSLQLEAWPEHDEKLTVDDTVEIVVQINGKVKTKITVPQGSNEDYVKQQVSSLVQNQTVKRVIFVPNRLINFVV